MALERSKGERREVLVDVDHLSAGAREPDAVLTVTVRVDTPVEATTE